MCRNWKLYYLKIEDKKGKNIVKAVSIVLKFAKKPYFSLK
jgi:hypothetical protein